MKTKRIIALVIVSVVALSGIAFAATPMQSINVSPNTAKVIVNGKNLAADNFNYNGTIYIPLRAVSEQMGASVDWNQSGKTATIKNSSDTPTTKSLNTSSINYYLALEYAYDDLYDGTTETINAIAYEEVDVASLNELIKTYTLPRDIYNIFMNSGDTAVKGLAENHDYYIEYLNKCLKALEDYNNGNLSDAGLDTAMDLAIEISNDVFDDRKECRDALNDLLK